MIYELKIKLKTSNVINNKIDTEGLSVTFSDMIEQQSPVSLENKKITIGAMDHQFHLDYIWQSIKHLRANEIQKISMLNEDGVEVFSIEDPLTNIIYVINFHEGGDMISFCYGKEN